MSLDQPDLFGTRAAALPAGLTYADELVSAESEADLIDRLAGVAVAPFRFQGWLGKRQTASFGWQYDFDNGSFEEALPIPDFLLPLRDHAGAFAGIAPDRLVQLLVTRYDPGAGIGWHRDRPVFDHVVGVSLGAPAALRLRRRVAGGFARTALLLTPRSVYHLSGAARYDWEHGIAPIDAPRWSITFRTLSDKGAPRSVS